MRIKHLLIIIALLAFIVPAPIAHAGGVVAVCDEAHLLAALAGGGTVTFACSGTITLTREITIATDTTIDGSGQEVTISGGDAVRTFYVSEGTAVILNALTIADGRNSVYPGGGGIYSPDSPYATTVLLRNTIVADSPSGGNCQGGVTDGRGNLSYPDTACPGINADPTLGPLQNNGGPTWTMALGPGSAAIDAADDAICAADPVNNLDQRDVARPQGAHCDIGALEQLRLWLPLLLANN